MIQAIKPDPKRDVIVRVSDGTSSTAYRIPKDRECPLEIEVGDECKVDVHDPDTGEAIEPTALDGWTEKAKVEP